MTYQQLTQDQRYQIYAFLKAGFPMSHIARELSVDKSTISRELKRNRGGRGYRPKQAQHLAESRRKAKENATRIAPETWQQVDALLRQDWSPEQISGTLKQQGQPSASPERIYQHVYSDKQRGGRLYKHLRCQKRRRKRYGTYDRRGQIANRRSIDERPAIVARRERLGDWEIDTIIGKGHQQAIVSIVERQSKLTRMAKVERKTGEAVEAAVIKLLKPIKDRVHTITSDNGKEFAGHQAIAEALRADFYFAHPYHSWERGLNENTNGLARQYFPKGSDFTTITDKQVQAVAERLNERPRKTLGYKTPNHVFFNSSPVALRC
ncbi:MAG TPA: IS30 family transposase [Nitrososphaera sp.]|jgi:IS30 family transposase|nr:IS30 family transposase [Nitrososphaera sp.]